MTDNLVTITVSVVNRVIGSLPMADIDAAFALHAELVIHRRTQSD